MPKETFIFILSAGSILKYVIDGTLKFIEAIDVMNVVVLNMRTYI